jgi:hypothetical protein
VGGVRHAVRSTHASLAVSGASCAITLLQTPLMHQNGGGRELAWVRCRRLLAGSYAATPTSLARFSITATTSPLPASCSTVEPSVGLAELEVSPCSTSTPAGGSVWRVSRVVSHLVIHWRHATASRSTRRRRRSIPRHLTAGSAWGGLVYDVGCTQAPGPVSAASKRSGRAGNTLGDFSRPNDWLLYVRWWEVHTPS